MPAHSAPKSSHNDPMKMEKPKKKSAMRKMSDKEKKLLKEHFSMHDKDASKADKARARMMVMRAGVDVKSMKSLHKLLGR